MSSFKEQIENNQLLLIILAVLLIAKLLVEPIINWQNQQLVDNQTLAKKVHKTAQLLNQQTALQSATDQVSTELVQLQQFYYPYQEQSQFRLTQQQAIEKLIAQSHLSLTNIGWQPAFVLPNTPLQRQQLTLNVSGKSIDFVGFIQQLERVQPYIEVAEFNVSLKGQNDTSLGRVNGSLRLIYYVQQTHTAKQQAREGE